MKTLTGRREQFVVDAAGERVAVLLDLPTYQRLREAEEEMEAIRALDAAQPIIAAELQEGDFVTLTEYQRKRARRGK